MANLHIAIHSINHIQKKMEMLEDMWNRFVFEKHDPQQMRLHVYRSWKRCQEIGVNPHQKQAPIVITDDQLVDWHKQSHLYHLSRSILQDLARQIEGTLYLITLCDSKGRILHLHGERRILQKAELMNFVIGADWSEISAGTNAIGTAIAEKQPIQIFSYEHFCQGAHPWICSAAPIHDPLSGQLLGVIDLTGPSDLAQPHSLGTAVMTAKSIEQRFQETARETLHHLQARFNQVTHNRYHEPIVLLDEALQVVEATPKALSLLQLEKRRMLWSLPEMEPLKIALSSLGDTQSEMYLPSRQLKVSIGSVFKERKRVGFLLHFHKPSPVSSTSPIPADHWTHIIGESKALKNILSKSQVVAASNVPILLTGESGTGKERFARAIHWASPRHRREFLAINCGAIPKELIASEIFGYEAGTFTGGNPNGKRGKFEEADGGTLFLDEIAEMPLDLQVYLLRVLQENEIVRLGSSKPIPVDVRIIAATNQNLEQLVQAGKFRSDLYFRLNVVQLALPPLRERGDDVLRLYNHFVQNFAEKHGKRVTTTEDDVLAFLRDYHWPGNIRELENAVEHAVLFADRERIQLSDLPSYLLRSNVTNRSMTPLEQEEKRLLTQLFQETKGNLSEMARRCNIARSTLYRKLKKYNIGVM
ncbi:sigma-54-dependent Fis family transcriptional regulator [Brevibacillus massiliensis]|uniref:sigma-54-dependent Fis family transcriptional regulator n=1 Tax=Brevibacillus massiliensis TaxID=1118054 RepID=UPI0004748F1E|nr:sigma-54-dependent Fis family transcriptional regulator [Brevibacillus massiliensis]